jgi:Zn-dependent protease with chaperone function
MPDSVDFFQKQDASRRWSLVFGLSFALMLVFFFGLMYEGFRLIIIIFFTKRRISEPINFQHIFAYHPSALVFFLTIFITTVVTTVSRLLAIKNGGSTFLATTLRAIPLGQESVLNTPQGKRQEKMLRNITSEMALAASIPEPEIYILPYEDGINAMAVGLSQDDTAIIVTKGSLKYLSRDELSGLIAHELSHIQNGDTRHFTIMSGWLHGLFFIQILGRKVITKLSRGKGAILGIFLIVLGFVASICGKIIQAAFSRSREWLADAAATQFTRDPKALADVLKKIGGLDKGSVIRSDSMPELRHVFLAKPDASKYFNFFASHPPLEERIWELDPNWDGWYHDFEKDPVDYLAAEPPHA